MSAFLECVLLGLLGATLIPVCVLLVQVVCALLPRTKQPSPNVERPSLAVLIPAHDEADGIGATLRCVRQQLQIGDRLLVVADNCSDDTAGVAAALGAEVLVRHDPLRRGKGYALDFGVRHLERSPPQVIVLVDADCELATGTINLIACLSISSGRPVQASYLMKSIRGARRGMGAIAEFACLVRNQIRPLGYLRLGLPCQLMGTGMAFPSALLCSLPLASGHIVEDLKLGLDCARAGLPPLFCPEAQVTSNFPSNPLGVRSQRTRWEHGHLGMIASELPNLILECLRGKGTGVLAPLLDLCVPPLAFLAMVVLILAGLSSALALTTGTVAPLALAGVVFFMLAGAISLSWLGFARELLPFGQLLLVPVYAMRKLPLYLKFAFSRQVEWVRSKRDEP